MYGNAQQDAEKIIEEVLSREEFAEKPVADLTFLEKILNDIFRILDKIGEKISELFRDLFDWLAEVLGLSGGTAVKAGGDGWIKAIVIILIVLVSLAIIVILTVLIVRAIKRSRAYKALGGGSFEEELEAFSNDSDTPYQMARQLEAEGDYRGAFRYLYISLLAAMSMAGIIVIHRSKTNRRYLREIKKNYEAVWAVSTEFTEWFNLSWYGRRNTDSQGIGRWFEKYDEIKAEIKKFSSEDHKAKGEKK